MRHQISMGTALFVLITAASAQTQTQATGSVQAGDAVKPVEPVAPAQSISVEGLSPSGTGSLSSTAPDSGPQPWKDVMGWITLQQGMRPDEVKALLGPDHRESVSARGTLWTYQDQKALLFGSVFFDKDGKLDSWSSPRF